MKVDELIGSLQNFEIVINNKEEKKGKSIAFVSDVDVENLKEIIRMVKTCPRQLCYLEDILTKF